MFRKFDTVLMNEAHLTIASNAMPIIKRFEPFVNDHFLSPYGTETKVVSIAVGLAVWLSD